MDTVNVSYTSPFAKPLLVTFCMKFNSQKIFTKLTQHVPARNGSALVLLSWTDVVSCYFNLRPVKNAGNGSNSHYIRILSEARPTPILVGLGQNTTTAPTTAPTNVVTVEDNGGTGTGAKIGIGVGVALGVLLLVAAAILAVWLLLRRRRGAKTRATGRLLAVDNESAKSDPGSGVSGPQSVPLKMVPMEAERTDKVGSPHELSSERMYEMDHERSAGELSAEPATSRLQEPDPRRFSWERTPVG
ncbi:uncharacterized protein L3040_008499 [Drepanopeziza brunnea f. sp. 'multigermtubi']|uniref:Uncharacterized protein n=1 Tax=Marssonina brunnea f. sp. multigermtubi (strain MB_m1) TaxID=1072389 RepID=K1WFW9_MARBU|nr:uncharacterized protein MBM_05694 [Drepanopeziza brunnea f. sp. 'multigermtubi' MB_m1]EKD16400.1 hypothetical protein MBM_05694 [Drepanopeziza brunnea f. sp. 'multigermtubi' MB_m1]KAJ5033382.1 hypothetical protein L3040_008499 [Drepanopeziza brunnea f. sp. 'multigermtubi']